MRPTDEQLAPLAPIERAAFGLADTLSHPKLTPLSVGWNRVVMGTLIWSCGGRRLRVHGLENVLAFDANDSLMLVANHRSFFDFFSVTAILYWRTKVSKRIFFPVRQNFFYDHPLGPVVNFTMTGMRMFPPIMRDKSKKAFNQYSVERCIAELNRTDVGTVLGLHPEGTRNKGDDPYRFLPAQPGVGRIALGATRAKVLPIFVVGMGQSIVTELRRNWRAPEAHAIDMHFGAPIDFSDLRQEDDTPALHRRASERCLDAIKDLAERHRSAHA